MNIWISFSSLSLAVWKVECQWQMPRGLDYYESQQYVKAGWKKKQDLQDSDARKSIAVASIRPFLHPHQAIVTNIADVGQKRKWPDWKTRSC
jgi:hypothetical protein